MTNETAPRAGRGQAIAQESAKSSATHFSHPAPVNYRGNTSFASYTLRSPG